MKSNLELRDDWPPVLSIVITLVVVGIGFLAGSLVVMYGYLYFHDLNETDFLSALIEIDKHPELKTSAFVIQAGATIGGLFLAPILLLRIQQNSILYFFQAKTWHPLLIIATVLVVIALMPLNSILIDWNSNIEFPPFLKEFQQWAREREDIAARQTEALTKFTSVSDFLIGMVVIAVLPGIGEEIVFRGLIQNQLLRLTKNAHAAIWISAMIFSAIHIQFFGFIPRMILGGLFGYIYYWTGNLSMAIIAHFINNAITLAAVYCYQSGLIEFDVDSSYSPPIAVLAVSVIFLGALLKYISTFQKSSG